MNDIDATFTIELTRNQLMVIAKACDLFCRLHIGQLSEVADLFRGRLPAENIEQSIGKYHEMKDILTKLQPMVTGMSYPYASLGVGSKQAHPDHATAYEVSGTIENFLHPALNRDPLKLTDEPPIKIIQTDSPDI